MSSLPLLGQNSEPFENKIALCKDCPAQQSYHTTQADYLRLLKKKEHFLEPTDLHEATLTMELEKEIEEIVNKVCSLREDELANLNYIPVRLVKKITLNELLFKNRVSMYVTSYYPYTRDCFKELEGINGFRLKALSLQIKSCFVKMDAISNNKSDIFNQLVE